MKVEINLIHWQSFSLGIFTATGKDEDGEFNILTLGFLLFSIDIYAY